MKNSSACHRVICLNETSVRVNCSQWTTTGQMILQVSSKYRYEYYYYLTPTLLQDSQLASIDTQLMAVRLHMHA